MHPPDPRKVVRPSDREDIVCFSRGQLGLVNLLCKTFRQAILVLVTVAEDDPIVDYATLPWFVAFVVTLIPFYHGALRHVDEAYIFTRVRPRDLTFLVDYLILFSEAGVLFLLALVIDEPQSFLYVFALLLLVDLAWAIMTHFLTNRFEEVRTWATINFVSLLVMALIHWTPMLDAAEPVYLVVLAVLRTAADYTFAWKFYFPE